MRIFVDANILVSVLNKEYPLFTYTSRILSLADQDQYRIYTSPVCLAIAFYFAEKKCGTALAKKKIEILVSNLHITEIGKSEVKAALGNKKIHDFEDGLEYYAALAKDCETIVTEDTNDYYFSDITVMNAELFLNKLLLSQR